MYRYHLLESTADALGELLFILQKYLLGAANFVKLFQSSKAPSSCLGAGQIFVKLQNGQILQFEGINPTKNISFLHNNAVKMENDQDFNGHFSFLEVLNATRYNLYGSQIFVSVAPPDESNHGSAEYSSRPSWGTTADKNENAACQEYSRPNESRQKKGESSKQASSIFTASVRFQREWDLAIKYFAVFKSVRVDQIPNVVETKFDDIFGRAKQVLST